MKGLAIMRPSDTTARRGVFQEESTAAFSALYREWPLAGVGARPIIATQIMPGGQWIRAGNSILRVLMKISGPGSGAGREFRDGGWPESGSAFMACDRGWSSQGNRTSDEGKPAVVTTGNLATLGIGASGFQKKFPCIRELPAQVRFCLAAGRATTARVGCMNETETMAMCGEDGIRRMVAGFYRRVRTDDLIGPMYPDDDWDGSEERLAEFVLFRLGASNRYLEMRGHPRLKARHLPFRIGVAERDRWLDLMFAAIDEAALPAAACDFLREMFR